MAKDSVLTIRPSTTQDDCHAMFGFLVKYMLEEVGRAEFDADKTFNELCRIANEEVAWIVEDDDGEIVASCGLIEAIGGHWYGVNESFLTERWLFVRKDYRRDSRALKLILEELQQLCNHVNLAAYVLIFDPSKNAHARISDRAGYSTVAYKLAFEPAGRMISVHPKRKVA